MVDLTFVERHLTAWPYAMAEACFEECQIHHIESWRGGGMTNLDNLVPLCADHNGLNQDDPAGPAHRGRIGRVGGRLAWISPKSGKPVFIKQDLRPLRPRWAGPAGSSWLRPL